jgi:predicted MFS family arabinose efflux permease
VCAAAGAAALVAILALARRSQGLAYPAVLFVLLATSIGVIGVFIAPAMYLNNLAKDDYRSSVQGLYVMLVPGGFGILGNLISGQLASAGLLNLYQISLWIALSGIVLLIVAFGLQRRAERSATRF